MKAVHIAKIADERQDGAIFGGYLFSFDHRGDCSVYSMDEIQKSRSAECETLCVFKLDKTELIVPHSNCVCFGTEYYDDEDEFPLLYTNIYNNYANETERKEGLCLVYRIERREDAFKSSLVQMIRIGFTDSNEHWRSSSDISDVRPYGNFVVDRDKNMYYAFTMCDEAKITRYFSFELPKVSDGLLCDSYNVPVVTLNIHDIRTRFDTEYHLYIQGACCHNSRIYSLEGFSDECDIPPAIRIIDIEQKKAVYFQQFSRIGIHVEPEWIDFYNGNCYFGVNSGDVYCISEFC